LYASLSTAVSLAEQLLRAIILAATTQAGKCEDPESALRYSRSRLSISPHL